MDPQTWTTGGGAWLALALVNAGLAEQKNRSRLRWFIVSMFVGPVAIFLIVVWPRVEGDWRNAPVTTLNIVRDVRDRWILAVAVVLLAALVLLVISLFTRVLAVTVLSLSILVVFAIVLAWLLKAKRRQK